MDLDRFTPIKTLENLWKNDGEPVSMIQLKLTPVDIQLLTITFPSFCHAKITFAGTQHLVTKEQHKSLGRLYR